MTYYNNQWSFARNLDNTFTLTSAGEGAFPKTVDGNPVTRIGQGAFSYSSPCGEEVPIPEGVVEVESGAFYLCKDLKKVSFPASVLEISPHAFQSCRSLSEIAVDAANPNYAVYSGALCSKDGKRVIFLPSATTSTFECPKGTVELLPYSLSEAHLKSVKLNDGLEAIGKFALAENPLTELFVPASVKRVGEGAVYGCRRLERAYVADSVKAERTGSIFAECTSLKELRLPADTKDLAWFVGLSPEIESIEALSIPLARVPKKYKLAMLRGMAKALERENAPTNEILSSYRRYCVSQRDRIARLVTEDEALRHMAFRFKAYKVDEIDWLVGLAQERLAFDVVAQLLQYRKEIGGGSPTEALGDLAIDEVSMADLRREWSWKRIGPEEVVITSWKGHGKDVIVPTQIGEDRVVAIGAGAFSPTRKTARNLEWRERLETVSLPSSVREIEEDAFALCRSLVHVRLPRKLDHIGIGAFGGCTALGEISLPLSEKGDTDLLFTYRKGYESTRAYPIVHWVD